MLRAARTTGSIAHLSPRSQLLSQASIPSRAFPSTARIAASRLPQSLRWYSDAPETKPSSEAQPEGETAQPSEIDTLKKDVEAKNKEVVDLKDKLLRSVADYRNLQERTKREVQDARDFALQKFTKDLLSSLDNLEHALRAVPAERVASPPSDPVEGHKDLVNLHQGLQMIDNVMLQTLKRHGVVRFDPAVEEEKFDPNKHEAVFMAPQPDKTDGVVFHTQQKGYTLNGRVLRAAQVGVVKNS
ncbi:GrpE-domain-containing protein [Microthyrium microscopicum]|uniref:GrpE protein homolog n=1 Tax=Microthyrium microscopicum TaxID=703497 RepID=A0A6A6U0N3_9PEZI|nr:GrpE-domain-containing protein [Microthyrium microscopicum]